MSLSTNDAEMVPRVPGDRWLFPAGVAASAFGGMYLMIAGPWAIGLEVAALALMAYVLVRWDRSRCELSYWNGRLDEDEWRRDELDKRNEYIVALVMRGNAINCASPTMQDVEAWEALVAP